MLQDPLILLDTVLPLPISCLPDRLRIVFVGKEVDYSQGLNILSIRRSRVRAALQFLKTNCPAYADITIDETRLSTLPEDGDTICEAVKNLVVVTGEEGDHIDTQGKSYVPDPLLNDDDNFGVDGLNTKIDECDDNCNEVDSEITDEYGNVDGDVPAFVSTGVFGVDGVTSAQDVNSAAIPMFVNKLSKASAANNLDDIVDSIPTDENEFKVTNAVASVLFVAVGS